MNIKRISRATALFFSLSFLGAIDPSYAAGEHFIAGKDFTVLNDSSKGARKKNAKIEVTEFFSYMCHFCNQFEPMVRKWESVNKKSIKLITQPVPGGSENHPWTKVTRLYYTIDALGLRKQMHRVIFNYIFVDKKPLNTPDQMWDVAKPFAKKKGITKKKFLDTISSFQVTLQLDKARKFVASSGVRGTPTMMVDGRIVINGTQAKGLARMLEITKFLVDEVKAGRI